MRITVFFRFFLAGLNDGFYSEGKDIKSRRLQHLKKRTHQQQMLITDIWPSTAGAGIPYSCGVMRTPFFECACVPATGRKRLTAPPTSLRPLTAALGDSPDTGCIWTTQAFTVTAERRLDRYRPSTKPHQTPPWLAEGSNVTLFKITLRSHISPDIPFDFFPTCIAAFLNRALFS